MSDEATWYAQLSGRFWRHPKALALSDAAGWLWCRALSYVVDNRTDGVVPSAVLKALRPRDGKKASAELVTAGLWETHPAGHVFHDYADHGMTIAGWEAKKEEARQRAAKSRAQKRDGHAAVTRDDPAPDPPTSHVTEAHGARDPSREDSGLRTQDSGIQNSSRESSPDLVARGPAPAPPGELSPESRAWVSAYGRAFERATGAPASSFVEHLPALVASGVDPAKACAGFFATPRMRKTRPPFRPDLLAENPAGWAACTSAHNGVSPLEDFDPSPVPGRSPEA